MTSRSSELRRRDRHVLGWSLGVAAVLHVAVFVLWPAWRVEPFPSPGDVEVEEVSAPEAIPLYVEVAFGRPEILEADGTVSADSPDRQLRAEHLMALPPECEALTVLASERPHGRVRLRVPGSGRAAVLGIEQRSGDACADEVIRAVAEALWYRWLPNDRFPAPLELIQPVTLVSAER